MYSFIDGPMCFNDVSHLTQVSGLKYLKIAPFCVKMYVSPYTGEWIEMMFLRL